jgi:hypothetical protein
VLRTCINRRRDRRCPVSSVAAAATAEM